MTKQDSGISKIVVRAVVYDENDRILLVRRSETSSRPGEWEFPGGWLDEGESLEQAIKRETVEEIGLEISTFAFRHSETYKYAQQSRLTAIFSATIKQAKIELSDEHDKYEWIDSSTYHNKKLSLGTMKYLNKINSTDNKLTKKPKNKDKLTTYKRLDVYTDGGSRGNPGPSATGFVIMNEQNEIIDSGGEYLGITTNNQAEYQAVKLALERCQQFQPEYIDFFIDSELVVKQMNGEYKIKNRDLWPIHKDIKELVTKYQKVTFKHIRREFNKLADAEVNRILDDRGV